MVIDKITEAEYSYFANNSIKRMTLGDVQGVDYRYNPRGWLHTINHQNLDGIDPNTGQPQDPGYGWKYSWRLILLDSFGMILGYDESNHIGAAQGATPQNGMEILAGLFIG